MNSQPNPPRLPFFHHRNRHHKIKDLFPDVYDVVLELANCCSVQGLNLGSFGGDCYYDVRGVLKSAKAEMRNLQLVPTAFTAASEYEGGKSSEASFGNGVFSMRLLLGFAGECW